MPQAESGQVEQAGDAEEAPGQGRGHARSSSLGSGESRSRRAGKLMIGKRGNKF